MLAKVKVYPANGRGNPPPNRIISVSITKGQSVYWLTDQNGWAIGYDIEGKEDPGTKDDRQSEDKTCG